MAVGDLLINNPIVMQSQQPEMDMPKLEENKSLWRSMLDRVRNDPNLRIALMSTAAGLMRSPGFGQNLGDVIGNSIAQGMGTYLQGRQMDVQNQLAEREQIRKEAETTTSGEVARQNASTYATAVKHQGDATQANIKNKEAELAIKQAESELNAELASRQTAAKETSAKADLIRAKAYRDSSSGGGGSTGQNVQLINQRKAALMALDPGLSEEEATLQAQNDILMSKQAGNPANIAKGLFETQVKVWQGNFENLGKTPSQEELEAMKQTAIATAKEFAKLNSRGKETPTTNTSGRIDRTGNAAAVPSPQEPESVVGRKVRGLNNQFAEIVGQAGDLVTLRLPNGQEITQPLEAISAYIITE